MAAPNFPAELSDELVYEGGFSDNPRDPGGPTNFGITLHTLSHFLGRQATVDELKAVDDPTKAAIYRNLYWNVVQGDALPSGIDLCVFDMAVNGGPSRAAKMLQGIVPGVVADGVIGPKTIAAVCAMSAPSLIDAFTSAREAFYRSLSTFQTFGHGWLSRVHSVAQQAMTLANQGAS